MSTHDDPSIQRRAEQAMTHFYLGQGFMEAPTWDEISDDAKNGFRSIVCAYDRGELKPDLELGERMKRETDAKVARLLNDLRR